MSKKLIYIVSFVLLLGSAQAAPLTDADLYFDPAGIVPDYYTRLELPDLTVQNTLLLQGDPNAIIGANILPMLKPGNYPKGFPFSQADYYYTPNIDYSADLTDGDLTVTFNKPGLYHVRVTYEDYSQDVYAVFAETWSVEKINKYDNTGITKVIDFPPSDVVNVGVFVEQADSKLDKCADLWEKNGYDISRIISRQDLVDRIKEKLGKMEPTKPKYNYVIIQGCGTEGNISTGAGMEDIPDKQIDLTSVEQFGKDVNDYVGHITLLGCSVGHGMVGKNFLKILADSTSKASAWDSPVIVVGDDCFAVSGTGNFVEVQKDSCVLLPADADAMVSAEGSCGDFWGQNSADLNFGRSENMWTLLLDDVVYVRFELPDIDLSLVNDAKLYLYGWAMTGAFDLYGIWDGFYHYPEIAVYGLKDGTASYTDDNGHERYGEDWLEGTGDWEAVEGITFNNAPANTGHEACSDGAPTCTPDLCHEGTWAPENDLKDIICSDTAIEISGTQPDWMSIELGSSGAKFIQDDTNGIVTFMITSPADMIQFFSKEYAGGAFAPTLELELWRSPCSYGDINFDDIVNFGDLARMAYYWLEEVPIASDNLKKEKCRYTLVELKHPEGYECPPEMSIGDMCVANACLGNRDCDVEISHYCKDPYEKCLLKWRLLGCAETLIERKCGDCGLPSK
jgi:hypothetical protein